MAASTVLSATLSEEQKRDIAAALQACDATELGELLTTHSDAIVSTNDVRNVHTFVREVWDARFAPALAHIDAPLVGKQSECATVLRPRIIEAADVIARRWMLKRCVPLAQRLRELAVAKAAASGDRQIPRPVSSTIPVPADMSMTFLAWRAESLRLAIAEEAGIPARALRLAIEVDPMHDALIKPRPRVLKICVLPCAAEASWCVIQ